MSKKKSKNCIDCGIRPAAKNEQLCEECLPYALKNYGKPHFCYGQKGERLTWIFSLGHQVLAVFNDWDESRDMLKELHQEILSIGPIPDAITADIKREWNEAKKEKEFDSH